VDAIEVGTIEAHAKSEAGTDTANEEVNKADGDGDGIGDDSDLLQSPGGKGSAVPPETTNNNNNNNNNTIQ